MCHAMKRTSDNGIAGIVGHKSDTAAIPVIALLVIERASSDKGKIPPPHQEQTATSSNNDCNRRRNRRFRQSSNGNRMGRDALALLEQSIIATKASPPTIIPELISQASTVSSSSSSSSSSASFCGYKPEEVLVEDDSIEDTRYFCSNLLILAEQQAMQSKFLAAKILYSQALRYQRAGIESSNEYSKEMISTSIDYEELFDLATTLHALGNVCYELKEYKEAKMYIKEAKQIKRQYYHEISSQTHIMMKFKSSLLSPHKVDKRKQHNHDYTSFRRTRGLSRSKSSCENLLAMALALETSTGTTDRSSTSRYNTNTNSIYRDQQDNTENGIYRTDIYYNNPKHTTTKTAFSQHEYSNLDIAYTIEDLGKACCALHEYDLASKYYKEALDIKRIWYAKHPKNKTNKTNHNNNNALGQSIVTSSSSTTFMIPNDEMKLVTTSFPDAAIFLKQRRYGYDHITPNNVDIAKTLHRLGELAHVMGKYHKARNKYVQALEMYQEYYNNHFTMNNGYKSNRRHPMTDKNLGMNTITSIVTHSSQVSNNDNIVVNDYNNVNVDSIITTLLMQLCQVNFDMKHMKYAKHYYSQIQQKQLLSTFNNQQLQQINELSNQLKTTTL